MLFETTGAREWLIKVRFVWLKDLIDDGEIVLIYVPSEELVADMLIQLQGRNSSIFSESCWP